MADQYDIVTLDEGKTAINVKSATGTYDTELASVITAVSQRLVDLCGPVVNRTFTNETYDGGPLVGRQFLDEAVDRGYSSIELRHAAVGPLATTTITNAVEYDSTGAGTTLSPETFDTKPADAYLVKPETALVFRRRSGIEWRYLQGQGNVVFTYTSGRAASTAAAPDKFKQAALIMIAHVWRQRGPQAGAYRVDAESGPVFGVAPFAVPNAVVELLLDDRRPDRVAAIG
ncbi:MAG TPA: hypothetical protein VHC63_13345 [Acidimicrobiales bacterium]|nr:hypothetical protein [Acidimicrobiales bacterium]